MCVDECLAKIGSCSEIFGRKCDTAPGKTSEVMKEPTTPEEVKVLHELLRSNPQRHLQIVTKWITDNPANSHAYFSRHFAWMELGEPQRALADLDMVVQL